MYLNLQLINLLSLLTSIYIKTCHEVIHLLGTILCEL